MASPDDRLDPTGFTRLNEQFYDGQPSAYFKFRLAILGQLQQDSEQFDAFAHSPFSVGALHVPADVPWLPPLTTDLASHLSVAESIALYHHVAEALIRLFIAHRGWPDCPWLEIARLRGAGDFRATVDALAAEGDDSLVPDVARVVVGSERQTVVRHSTPTERSVAAEEIATYIRFLARTLNAESPAYNAVKHGFALIVNTDASAVLRDSDGKVGLERHGLAADYLTRRDYGEGSQQWGVTSTWVSPTLSMPLTVVALFFIDALWHSAREHYISDVSPVRFQLDVPRLLDVVRSADPPRLRVVHKRLPYVAATGEPDDELIQLEAFFGVSAGDPPEAMQAIIEGGPPSDAV